MPRRKCEVNGMRFSRWWPEEASARAAADDGGRLGTRRRRRVLRAGAGTRLAWLALRAHPRGPAPNASDDTAVPGPRERSAGWEVRTHHDLLYFLHSGKPRFVMSEAMAQRGYAAIESLLSGGQDAVFRAPSPVAPAPQF